MHTPVLLQEVINNLDIKPNGKYIDATFGEGGHSLEILKQGGSILGFEWDKNNYELKKEKYNKEKNLKLVNENFINIKNIAQENGFEKVDGILFDFGLSMEQIAMSGKGFSYKKLQEPLDMRIGNNIDRTAADILNEYDLNALSETFIKNAEEIRSEELAKKIIRKRSIKKFEVVNDIVELVHDVAPNSHEFEPILRRLFQALRIEVNNEFENLHIAINDSWNLLNKNGRLLVISFHSLEDREVKQLMNQKKREYNILKPIRSKSNFAFERSATLRVAIKKI